ncbi:MAG: DUF2262 domain-containing protein [Planctomycetota bacterium]
MSVAIVKKGIPIRFLDGPYVSCGAPTMEALGFVDFLIGDIPNAKKFAAQRLLEMYNSTWTDVDHPTLALDSFISKMGDLEIVIYDEVGSAQLYFSDGDMFGGHSIDISYSNSKLVHVDIVG